jgi:hypothetical protein
VGELVFFAIIILFSVLESVARARKQREGGGAEGSEKREGRPRSEGRGRRPRDEAGRLTRPEGARSAERESSDGMIPEELWEEIAGLAAGRPAPSKAGKKGGVAKRPRPRQAEPRPQAPSSGSVPELRGRFTPKALEVDEHPVHLSHAGYGTDPSERAKSEQDWRPSEHGNRNAKRVRAMLRGSGADALKQAVILREVLGPPVAMRDD